MKRSSSCCAADDAAALLNCVTAEQQHHPHRALPASLEICPWQLATFRFPGTDSSC